MSTSAAQTSLNLRPRIRGRRFVVVGAGGRANTFIRPLATSFRQASALVALCDPNPVRLDHYNQLLAGEWRHPAVPNYRPEQFEQMLRETRADTVIVCTRDDLHADYCVRAMEHGCDVVVEKPLAISAEGCNAVIEASKRTGRRVRVTFNCRFMPWARLLKQLLMEGRIGEVISAQVDWMLDARKGVTYFARWHGQKQYSGGLMVHKATHHLDLMNWWLDAVPATVYGLGRRAFFGASNKHKHGIGATPPYYNGYDTSSDPYAPLPDPAAAQRVDLRGAAHDGYRGDRSAWRDRDLDIEDTMSVLVGYNTGVSLTYNLHAFLPRQAATIAFNGTRGRLEFHLEHSDRVLLRGSAQAPPAPAGTTPVSRRTHCIVHPMFAEAYEVPVPVATGDHDGADPLMVEQVFAADPPADTLGAVAGAEQGAASAIIGIAANQSFATGEVLRVGSICPALRDARRLGELD